MSELIISVSGLRGVIGETLSPEVAMRYAVAFSETVSESDPFVITRDGRPSGTMLADAIHAALNAVGRSSIDAGVAATPTTGVLIRETKSAGGIQISASHNPLQYNGLKLFSSEGRVIPKGPGESVLQKYLDGTPAWVSHEKLGKKTILDDTISLHLEKILKTVDVEAIRKMRFMVLLDSNRGAGSILGRALLEALGCETVILGNEPDGLFEHTPEPTSENLQGVLQKVKDAGADIGFCQDPDADRLAVIDENGRYIGEEYTVPLCVEHVLKNRKIGPIVINCATSRMTIDIAEKYGVPCYRSAVGEANVVDLMKEKEAVFGGEGNGGPIDPEVGFVRDSFVGMALILDAMAAGNEPLSVMADAIPSYSIIKEKASIPREKIPVVLDAISVKFPDLPQSRLDGLRIDWPDAWLLIRGSNTEPIVRAIAEARTEEEARKLCAVLSGIEGNALRD